MISHFNMWSTCEPESRYSAALELTSLSVVDGDHYAGAIDSAFQDKLLKMTSKSGDNIDLPHKLVSRRLVSLQPFVRLHQCLSLLLQLPDVKTIII
jgi:hypothetical protein